MSAGAPNGRETMNGLVAAAAAAMEDDSRMTREGILDRKRATGEDDVTGSTRKEDSPSANLISSSEGNKRSKTTSETGISAAKSRRLEQNRRAAIESRRRKKVMVEELQRSVAFYTKANASLSLHNRELETKLILAKQRMQHIASRATVNQGVDSSNPMASKSEHQGVIISVSDSPKSHTADVKVGSTVASPDTASPGAAASLGEANEATQTVSKVPCGSLWYTAEMARLAATSNLAGAVNVPLTTMHASIPNVNLFSNINSKPLSSDMNEGSLDETEESYIESLKQFVAQQAAVASAAAASANAAMEAIKYHEMLRANGHTPTARFPFSQLVESVPATSPVKKECGQNQVS
eukprot:CCRYP_006853-RB/>CCRYP_006853-RB protein AED:0.03 eAED:0.03 QI:205/1/1/1/1/1/3/443/351